MTEIAQGRVGYNEGAGILKHFQERHSTGSEKNGGIGWRMELSWRWYIFTHCQVMKMYVCSGNKAQMATWHWHTK